ncbi:tetratricopeptide repeat protein (plasmid) [Nostoc sp. UHCC 0926]|uniref:tetratricopeptide repeat protein n=1 Tax=Nostoc sp. UHCC 0926 TaxID=3025190 RepID=UPI00235DDE0E|nr:tetratricopeptide repeat protein [Nostoc sp. UHCC 0926]WDD36624.1 tetratricopeptide repeat protein [Nostoc sp. UHCC 0926]
MARKKYRLRKIKRFLSVLLLSSMFLGTGLLSPTFAHITSENYSIQSLSNAQNLYEQGRKFYEAEQFAEAVKVWQHAISAFKSNGDELRQAMTLGDLSLAYQQLGNWSEAENTQFRKKTSTDTPSWLNIAQLLSPAIEQARNWFSLRVALCDRMKP